MSRSKEIMRHKARECALQALYQWQYTRESPLNIELQFFEEHEFSKIDQEYFSELLQGVAKNTTQLDKHLQSASKLSLGDLNPVELNVLRIAIYEFVYHPEVPYKVVINEALKITKTFGAQEGFKFVNGVLDALAKELRPFETGNPV